MPAFDEGIDYQRVAPAQPVETGDKIEVLELFWYGCPHCFHLEPVLEVWLKKLPKNVAFRRMPAVLGDTWLPHTRAYYTAEVLGVLDRINEPLFQAIHVDKKPLLDEASLADFFVSQGVSREDFTRTFHSFTVESKVRRAVAMTRRYGIDGVPAMIVDGKYRTGGSLAGGQDKMMQVVDFLIGKAAEERAAAAKSSN
jgi:thiol:disulfide interchange protein DsbA